MTRYCGELREISGTSGGCHPAPGHDPSTTRDSGGILRNMGGIFGMASALPLLIIGNRKFRNLRPCHPALESFLREGEIVCIYVYRHLLHRQVIIGVRSGDGPSWIMSNKRMLATVTGYVLAWPVIAGIPAAFAGWFFSIPFGMHATTTGIALGIVFGTAISWLSAVRLITAWRGLQRG